ncbi:MAG TPA: sulfite oxidase [Candidatus Polarisedimenticolaceae bacterium]|nr:sulfite oxidase [Candidatus Polarisedimenticolaceae bacterium]
MIRRRQFLETSTLAALGTMLAGSTRAFAASEPAHDLIVRSLLPENLETPIAWFDRLVIPNDVFFVRSHFGVPRVGAAHTLRVEGTKPLDLTPADLAAMPQTTVVAVLQCAGNGRSLIEPRVPGVQWGHGAMGQASWTGVRLKEILDRAGVPADAKHVQLEGADAQPKPTTPAFHRSIPLDRALDVTTLVALKMNGEPLSHAHGAPFRLVVPGWAGDHWMKWLRTIRPQAAEAAGFYMQTGYKMPKSPVEPGAAVKPEDMASLTTFPVKSVIARPADGGKAPRGTQEVAGVAFSGLAPIAGVAVSTDGGSTWQTASLEGEAGVGRWQVFRYGFKASPGNAQAMARAIDAKGNTQPEKLSWNPSGYFWNAWHRVQWEVV